MVNQFWGEPRLNKSIYALIVAFLLSAFINGCVYFVPYKRPPQNTSQEEREIIYKQQRVNLDPVSGILIGGRIPAKGPRPPNEPPVYSLSDYYHYSGDLQAEAQLKQIRTPAWESVASLTTGLVVFLVAVNNRHAAASGPIGLAGLAAGYVGGLTLASWGRGEYILPAADQFNAFLRDDLGLAQDKNLDDRPSGILTENEGKQAPAVAEWYGSIGAGLSSISNYDVDNYYLYPGASASDNIIPTNEGLAWQCNLGGGVVVPGGATLEGRIESVMRGQPGRYYDANTSSETPYKVMDLNALNLGLIPGYTFTLVRFSHGQKVEAFAGCQFGAGYLLAHGFQDDSNGNDIGDYYLKDLAFQGGPIFRLEFPSTRYTITGIEIGYRVEKFTDIPVYGSSGTYDGQASPDQTLRGSPAFLDFSGMFINLNIQFGRFQ